MIINKNRTDRYIATVNLEDVGDQEWIKTIRRVCKETNSYMKSINSKRRTYVKLQGRGPRIHDGHRYFQSLPLSIATKADVYVYPRDPYYTGP